MGCRQFCVICFLLIPQDVSNPAWSLDRQHQQIVWPQPRPPESETLGGGLAVCVLTSPSGDLIPMPTKV